MLVLFYCLQFVLEGWDIFHIQSNVSKVHTTQFIITFMEIVSMMNIKVPSPNFRDAHVMSTELRCLHIPNDIPAVAVLVTNLNHGCCYTIHPLPVNIKSIPGISELYNRISFKCFFKQNAFYGYSKVDELQRGWNCFGRQLELNGGQVSSRTRAVVHKVEACAWDLQTFLYHLKRESIHTNDFLISHYANVCTFMTGQSTVICCVMF